MTDQLGLIATISAPPLRRAPAPVRDTLLADKRDLVLRLEARVLPELARL